MIIPVRDRCRRGQRGSAAVELVIVIPGIMMVLGLLLAGGRVWFVRAAVQDAAESSARAASLARTPGQATLDARSVAAASLSDSDLHCATTSVRISTRAFAMPVGQPATVDSEVTCTVTFGDIFLPGMPGWMVLHGEATSALDTYRTRP